MKPRCFYF